MKNGRDKLLRLLEVFRAEVKNLPPELLDSAFIGISADIGTTGDAELEAALEETLVKVLLEKTARQAEIDLLLS